MSGMAVGARSPVLPPAAADAISYEDLYARRERGNRRATEIDPTRDRVDWEERLTPSTRPGRAPSPDRRPAPISRSTAPSPTGPTSPPAGPTPAR